MLMPRDWLAGAFRNVVLGEEDCHTPCSLFQSHPDAVVYVTPDALKAPVPEIRVYNK
jgi:hypothetical protein